MSKAAAVKAAPKGAALATTAPAQRQPQAPAWVATTPLLHNGQRIATGEVVPDLTAELAAELGNLVEPAAATATEAATGGEGASTTTSED